MQISEYKILLKKVNATLYSNFLKVAFSSLMIFNIFLSIVFLLIIERKVLMKKERLTIENRMLIEQLLKLYQKKHKMSNKCLINIT